MKKFTLSKQVKVVLFSALSMIVSLSGLNVSAQTAGSYTFTQNSGTYTPITGGIVINNTIPDSWQSGAITLAPGFYFCGVTYTTAYVTSNGVMGLGGTAGPGTTTYNGIATTGGGSGVNLCVFGSDQIGSSATGAAPEIRYQLVGNEHVFQWKDISRYPASTDRMNYQVRLNVITGTVTYIYSITSVGTSTSYQPAVGIRTATTAGNWQSRTVANSATSSWDASALSTATSDLCRFTSTTPNPKQPATGQTYVYTPPTPPPSCTSLTFPTTSTTVVSPASICVTGNVSLSLGATIPTGGTGITFVWQSSPNNATWTDIATTYTPTYSTTTPITASTWYRCKVRCNTTDVLTSTSAQAVVTNPGIPTVTGSQRCGPGTVTLSATPPAGSGINWYATAIGGAPLATGVNTYNTGYLPSTTTFYAAAASGTSPGSGWVGNGTLYTSGQPHPFYPTYMGSKVQFLVKASELVALGLGAGTVNSIGFDVATVTGASNPVNIGDTIFNMAISMKPTALNDLATTFESGLSPCYSNTAYVLQANTVNTFNFGTPFPWDGSSNVIVEVCFAGPAWGGTRDVKYTSGLPFQASHYQYDDNNLNQCSAPTGFTNSTSTSRPNMKFNMTLGCTGPRQAVVATINPSTPVVRTSPAVVCNNAVATVVLTPPTPAYSGYVWSPVTNLYSDAAATTPYGGGSATTVYMKTTNVGTQTYYMMAGNPTITTGCTFADTMKIWVQPGNVTIKGQPDTICVAGTTKLSLDSIDGYFPGTIQWQKSTDGINYTNIAGATNPTYTTGNLTFGNNTYYKALISAGSAVCQSPVKYVVIANPVLVSAPDSFHCGPGNVTLNAVTGGNGSAVWYDNATGGLPIASGSPFITPYLTATTSYYVSSGGGGSAGNITVGAGASTSSDAVTPFYGAYGGYKHQFLIRATELLAAGIPPGAKLTTLGLDVVSSGTTFQGFAVSMATTAATALNTTWQTGMVPVKTGANMTTTAGINTITFDAPFIWNGTSNLVIQTCWGNNNSSNTTNTIKYDATSYAATAYKQIDGNVAASVCSQTTTTATLSERPKFILGYDNRCESGREEVVAYIRPQPIVDLGDDINKCVEAGTAEVLDAGVQPDGPQFLWDNGSVSQVRAVSESGSYSVKVTNQYTCAASDTINVILRPDPIVNLGNDTTVCNGVVLTLNPGNGGIDYYWNNGQITQSINVSSAGTYSVFVTNSEGCTKADTIVINMDGALPSIQGINISNNGQYTFQFTVANPQNVIGYKWDFGDGSAFSYQASPTHTYPDAQNYVVVLGLSSSCGFLNDSISTHIVGINQLDVNKDELTVYPNPTREVATILNRGALKMEQIEVYNVLGQLIYKEKADNPGKHELNLGGLASGIYTIQVYTDKGNVARKLEIIK